MVGAFSGNGDCIFDRGRSYRDLIEYFFVVRDCRAAVADDVLQALENGGKHSGSNQVLRNDADSLGMYDLYWIFSCRMLHV